MKRAMDCARNYLDIAGVMIVAIGPEQNVLFANKKACEISGYDEEELVGSNWFDTFIPDSDRDVIKGVFDELIEGKIEPWEYLENIILTKSGEEKLIAWHNTFLKDEDGKIIATLSSGEDITERRQVEKQSHLLAERLELATHSANIGIWDWDIQKNELVWDDRMYELYGIQKNEFTGAYEAWLSGVHPDDRDHCNETIQMVLRGEKEYDIEFRVLRPDGTVRIIKADAQIVRDSRNTPLRMTGINYDITERKKMEEAQMFLLECGCKGEDFFESLAQYLAEHLSMDFVCIDRLEPGGLDARTVAVYYNGKFEDNITYALKDTPCGDVVGKTICCFPRDVCSLFPRDEVLKEINANSYVGTTLWSSRGEPIGLIAVIGSRPLENPRLAESILKLVAVRAAGELERRQAEDELRLHREKLQQMVDERTAELQESNNSLRLEIVKREAIEQDLLRAQNMESIGILAGGIAHDFNNLLQGLFGYLSMAKMNIEFPEKALAMLKQAENALELSVHLTSQLLTFSKGGKPAKKLIELPSVIMNAVKFALSGSRTAYRFDMGESLLSVYADKGQLSQVIQNITLNADQAMASGGTIVISARDTEAPGDGVPALLEKGRYVVISIEDTGGGIPAEYLSQIFNPYFTTRTKGVGLGLTTSYSIIKNHGGLIDVSSREGTGTTFTIYIPAVEDNVKAAGQTAFPVLTGKVKVLVMDDEELVRKVIKVFFDELGHDVELAGHGEEALARYSSAKDSGRPFDVVILDLTIRGGMGGLDTLKRLKEIDPDVKAIVSSGYSNDSSMSEYRKNGFIAALNKPYDMDKVQAALNEVMG